MNKETKEIVLAEIVSITGGLVAGLLLSSLLDEINTIVGILIFLPGFLEMRGNISGSLAARLGSSLHKGTLNSDFKKSDIVDQNIIATFILVIVVSAILGFVATLLSFVIFNLMSFRIFYIALFSGILSNVIQIPLTTITTIYLYKKNFDPDNIMGPYITTIGDIVSILSLFIAIIVIK
jgi:mgtE-like transporter